MSHALYVAFTIFALVFTVVWTLVLFYLAFCELTAQWRLDRQHERRLKEIRARREGRQPPA